MRIYSKYFETDTKLLEFVNNNSISQEQIVTIFQDRGKEGYLLLFYYAE